MQRALQAIGASVSPYFFIARIRILMAMAYRFEVFSAILVQVILMASTLYIWRTAFQNDSSVSGVSLPQMLTYGVMSALLTTFWAARVADTIRDRVTQGQISTDLIRPTEPLLLWLAEDVGQSICSLLTKGLPLLACGFLLVGEVGPASWEAVAFFLPACVFSYLILWLMTALVGLVVFWTIEFGQLQMVKDALVNVLSGSFVPLWFFPDWLARLCAWLPFVYTYQGTLGIYIGKTQGWDSARILGIQFVWVLALGLLLLFLWKKARRKVLVQGGQMKGAFSHYAGVACYSAKLSLQRQLEYPAFLLSWGLMIPIHYFSGIAMLFVLSTRFEALSGWTFPQIAFLYGLALLSHGLQVVFFIPTWQIEWMVTNAGFDRLIVRPMDVLFQLLTRVVNLIGCIDLIPGTMIFFYGCLHLDIPWSGTNVLLLVVTVFGATLLRAGLYLMVNSLAFWTMRSGSLNGLILEIQQRGSMYPLSFYPWFLQWIFSLLIPVAFISFYPAADWLNVDVPRPLPVGVSLATPVVGMLVFWIGTKVFRAGLERYESTGS